MCVHPRSASLVDGKIGATYFQKEQFFSTSPELRVAINADVNYYCRYLMCNVLVHTLYLHVRSNMKSVCVYAPNMNDAVYIAFSNNVCCYTIKTSTHTRISYWLCVVRIQTAEILICLLNGHKFVSRKYNITIKRILTMSVWPRARKAHSLNTAN